MGAANFDAAARAYFFDATGAPHPIGHMLANPAFAQTLKAIRDGGAGAFYRGDIASQIVEAAAKAPNSPGDLTASDLAGYKVETLLGPDATWLPGALSSGVALKQAYVALRAPVGNGLDFKIGQFDPIIGYEVTDSYANPNFSRSLAFANLEPYGHQGVLATYQFSDVIGASVGVSNNSNTGVYASGAGGTLGGINGKYGRESAKSYMAGIVLKAPDSTGWLAGSSLYAGIVKGWQAGGNNDPVNYYVGGSLSTPWKELSLGAAYDYLGNGSTAGRSYGNAISLYASYQATEKLKLNVRGEYATSDYGAFLPNVAFGKKDKVVAATLTADYALWANVVTRAELRWDSAAGGSNLHPFDGHKNDVSLALNVIYKF